MAMIPHKTLINQEEEALWLLAIGHTREEAAEILSDQFNLTPRQVNRRIDSAINKLGALNTTEAVIKAFITGSLSTEKLANYYQISIPQPQLHRDPVGAAIEGEDQVIEFGREEKLNIALGTSLNGHENTIIQIAWSLDGQYLASSSDDKTIRIWPLLKKGVHWNLEHTSPVSSVAWAMSGTSLVASATMETSVWIWHWPTRAVRHVLHGHDNPVICVHWSPDGSLLAAGLIDGSIHLWDTENFETDRILRGHSNQIQNVVWSPDGSTLASCSSDNMVCLWDPRDSTSELPKLTFRKHTDQVLNLAWSPDSRLIASVGFDRCVRLWSPSTGSQMEVLGGHTDCISCVSFSCDNSMLASKSADGTVRLWDCNTWEPLGVINEETPAGTGSLAFHPKLPFLATLGDYDKSIRLWKVGTQSID
jgi:WD40 repeat protein/DNA-binding CsgD family transcriptional regulator